jgi:hypothetical protein
LSAQITIGAVPARSAKDFLIDALRAAPGEAAARVQAAVDLGPRRSLSGQRLPALFPATAAAEAAGLISARHTAVIRRTIDALPVVVQDACGPQAEQVLVRAARTLNPAQLQTAGHRLIAHLHPDGPQPSEADHQRRRGVSLRRNGDRSADLIGRLTPEATVVFDTVIEALAQPRAGEDGTLDARTAPQRRHDALLEVLQRVRRGGLPEQGGVPTTIYVTMTAEQFQTGTGLVATSKGDLLTVEETLNLADEALLYSIPLDPHGAPLGIGRKSRFATPLMRHALSARDQGCCFPGCSIPPGWTEAHHVLSWLDWGETKVPNLALLCEFHHHNFERLGWVLTMPHAIPTWIPPAWHDPAQRPFRNHAHHLPIDLGDLKSGNESRTGDLKSGNESRTGGGRNDEISSRENRDGGGVDDENRNDEAGETDHLHESDGPAPPP